MFLFSALDPICCIVFLSSTCLTLSSRKFLISTLHTSWGFFSIFSLRSRGIRIVYVEDINYRHTAYSIMFRKIKTFLSYKSVCKCMKESSKYMRWKYKLESDQTLKVTVKVIGVWFSAQVFVKNNQGRRNHDSQGEYGSAARLEK